jgi:multiple sugar transport system permease protein
MQSSGFVTWFFNSLVVSAVVTLLVLLLQSMAGYAFAKKAFPGRDGLFVGVLAGMMVPGAVVLIPTFLIARELHLINTYGGLIIPPVAFPLGVFLLRQFIRSIPTEILYAAQIDGAGEFAIYWRIILPLSSPALATLAIVTFMGQWQSLVWPLLVASDDAMKTLPVGLASFTTQFSRDYGVQMAGAFLSVLPLLVVFLFMQQYVVRGLTASAVKG